jgi:hypothetical protein
LIFEQRRGLVRGRTRSGTAWNSHLSNACHRP